MTQIQMGQSLARQKTRIQVYDVALVVGASLLMALSAGLRVHLPFSPVPLTAQTLVVLLSGALLGSRRGAFAVLLYLLQGMLGLPVFAGGAAGVATLWGPTGGYLLGFVAAAALTGWLAERGWGYHFGTILLALGLGNLVIYAVGIPWLAVFVGGDAAWALGGRPFIVGDVIKLALALGIWVTGQHFSCKGSD